MATQRIIKTLPSGFPSELVLGETRPLEAGEREVLSLIPGTPFVHRTVVPAAPDAATSFYDYLKQAELSPAMRQYFESRFGQIQQEFDPTGKQRATWWASQHAPVFPEAPEGRVDWGQQYARYMSAKQRGKEAQRLLAQAPLLERQGRPYAPKTYRRLLELVSAWGQSAYEAYQAARAQVAGKTAPKTTADPWLEHLKNYGYRSEWLGMAPRQRGFRMSRFAPKARFLD